MDINTFLAFGAIGFVMVMSLTFVVMMYIINNNISNSRQALQDSMNGLKQDMKNGNNVLRQDLQNSINSLRL